MTLQKLIQNGEYEKVIELLENKASSPEEFIILGIAYYKLSKRNKAISAFKSALNLDPKNYDALFNIAEIYYELRKIPQAKKYALWAWELNTEDWAINDILAKCYIAEGFFEKATLHMNKALKTAPSEFIRQLKSEYEIARTEMMHRLKLPKLSIICYNSNFIWDIVFGLSDKYWVRTYYLKENPLYNPQSFNSAIKEAVDWADIVWFEWANEVAIIGTNCPGEWTKPVVVRLHSYEIFTDMPLKINWAVVDALIFVASHIREIFFERFPELRAKVKQSEIVYNGIDLSKIPFKERKPGYEIAWVGYINYKKAPELALQVIKKLVSVDPRYRLHFAGDFQDPRYEVYMKHMVKIMGLENNVIFYGWVDDMDEFWEDKNYLLHTSLHEGHPYAVMEAMARGVKPVIHWFRGAEELYEKEWLFRTIDNAVEMILASVYNSEEYRKHVTQYTFDKQISSICKILRDLQNKLM